MPVRIILASTSRYRRELLGRLGFAFDTIAPGVDESAFSGESPFDLAVRLARAKAQAVATVHDGAIVIGSDQVCELDGDAIGKPGAHDAAVAQLRRLSGREATFHTAVAVARDTGLWLEHACTSVRVRFRALDDDAIEHYLRLEQPYDCAGSAKSEALGIALLESIESDDPTALVGLPLIRTCRLLRAAGFDPLLQAPASSAATSAQPSREGHGRAGRAEGASDG
jgi:septum formation protein